MAARPPGGPPGLGPACGPPSEPPPPAPPGLFLGSPGPGPAGGGVPAAGPDDGTFEKQHDITGTIAGQVARLLEAARVDTENKVKVELKGIRDAMVAMDGRLDQLLGQLDSCEPRNEVPLDAEHIGQLLSKIEQQWGQEIRTLKEELHQTILAHNHNADLIKHHKDTIDVLRERCTRHQGGGGRSGAEIQQQLGRLDALTRQQQAQRKMDPLLERLTNLERNVANVVAARSAAWRYPAMPPMPMMPGMRPPMGNPAAMMAHAASLGLGMPGGPGGPMGPGGKGGGMRPPFGGQGQGRGGGGAVAMPREAEVAMLPMGIDADEDESALDGGAGAP